MLQIIITVATPILSAAFGFVLGNWDKILRWQKTSQREDVEFSKELMQTIKEGQQEILGLYTIIEQMNEQNRKLKTECAQLTLERDEFKSLYEDAKTTLDKVKSDFDACAERVKKFMQNSQSNNEGNQT